MVLEIRLEIARVSFEDSRIGFGCGRNPKLSSRIDILAKFWVTIIPTADGQNPA